MIKKIAIGLYSNLKGLELGAKTAGFLTPFSTDIDPRMKDASIFLTDNPADEVYHIEDVRTLNFNTIKHRLLEMSLDICTTGIDLLVAGPPCFGFTLLSKNRSFFNELNFLMIETLRLVNELKPKAVLIEQVPALLTKPMRPFFYLFLNYLCRLTDYDFDYETLNAANFGCYQSRERVIFILVRKDLKVKPSLPLPGMIDLAKQSAFVTIGAELIKTEQFKNQGDGPRIINGVTNVFPTLTSGKVKLFRDRRWQEMTLADRKILAHMEHFDMSSVLEESTLTKKLGMMVLPPFAEALCRHVHDIILA